MTLPIFGVATDLTNSKELSLDAAHDDDVYVCLRLPCNKLAITDVL